MLAFIVYWGDLNYDFINSTWAKTLCLLSTAKDTFNVAVQYVMELDQEFWVFSFVSLAFAALIVRVWRIKHLKKSALETEPVQDLVPLDAGELPSWGPGNPPVCSISQISPGQYQWQATHYTRAQIKKLVSSDAYKRMIRERGTDLAAWNWKT